MSLSRDRLGLVNTHSTMSQNIRYYIGIDVGTGSVRAALVNQSGSLMASSVLPTKTWRDENDHRIFEQSTKDIWSAITSTIKACLQESGVKPEDVKGLGFDSTCSLCVTDVDGKPIAVTKGELLGEYGERNVILWLDHRAEKEADLINSTGSTVLDYVGGAISVSLYCLFSFKLRYLNRRLMLLLYAVGDGSTKDPLVEKPHEAFSLQQMPVLRLARFPHLSSY